MSVELRCRESDWERLRRHLLKDGDEHAAVLICGHAVAGDRVILLVREVVIASEPEQAMQTATGGVKLSPAFLARVAKQAAAWGGTVVVCHSHPGRGPVLPSRLDLRTEAELCGRALAARLPGRPVGALIVGLDGFNGRGWFGPVAHPLTRVSTIGRGVRILTADTSVDPADPGHQRQVLAWGPEGQRAVARARIAVVGCGGIGFHLALQLAHLGIGELALIDFDRVEASNLARLVGASPDTVGLLKTDVLARLVRAVSPSIVIREIPLSVLDVATAHLADCDIVVSATDGHGSRAWLNEFSAQYLSCLVDLGVEIQPGAPTRAGGGVRVVRPGQGCLQCAGTLAPALVREEFLSPAQRDVERRRGYLRDDQMPTPSVVALNGVVASLAVLEICDLLTGVLGEATSRLLYRAERRAVTTATLEQKPWCYVCDDRDGLLALGDARTMPRPDVAAA